MRQNQGVIGCLFDPSMRYSIKSLIKSIIGPMIWELCPVSAVYFASMCTVWLLDYNIVNKTKNWYMIKILFRNHRFQKTEVLDKQKLKQVVCKAMEIFRLPFLGKIIDMDGNTSTNDMLLVPSWGEKNKKGERIYDFNTNIWKESAKFTHSMSCELVTYIDYNNHLRQNEYDVTQLTDDEFDKNDIGMYFVI